jgi:DEAD/DEAH box helicase domain-containing protein
MMFKQAGIDISVKTGSKSDVGHGRIMELEFSSGKKLFIRLDQGVSFWRAAWVRSDLFAYNFRASAAAQRDRLLNLDIDIENSDAKTQMFLKVRPQIN